MVLEACFSVDSVTLLSFSLLSCRLCWSCRLPLPASLPLVSFPFILRLQHHLASSNHSCSVPPPRTLLADIFAPFRFISFTDLLPLTPPLPPALLVVFFIIFFLYIWSSCCIPSFSSPIFLLLSASFLPYYLFTDSCPLLPCHHLSSFLFFTFLPYCLLLFPLLPLPRPLTSFPLYHIPYLVSFPSPSRLLRVAFPSF